MPSPNYANPDSMTREELLTWAKWNYAAWQDPQANPHGCEPAGSQSSWYILFLWGERTHDGKPFAAELGQQELEV